MAFEHPSGQFPLTRSLPRETADGLKYTRLFSSQNRWTADALAEATGGFWASPPPVGWYTKGFAPSRRDIIDKVMLIVRTPLEFSVQQARKLAKDAAGIMCETPEGCLELGIPVLVVKDISEAQVSLGRYARDRFHGKVIAITGSAGKTSTVYLLADMIALFDRLDYVRSSTNTAKDVGRTMAFIDPGLPFCILEMTYDKIGLSSRISRPDVALITHIGEAHLHVMKNLHGVAKRKSLIFSGMVPGGYAILPCDNSEYPTLEQAARQKELRIIRFGRSEEAEFRLIGHEDGRIIILCNGVEYRPRFSLPLPLAANALAALACVSALGFPIEPCLNILENAQAEPGRGRVHTPVFNGKSLTLIDDSYNANPDSLKAGLQSLAARTPVQSGRVAVLGDFAELGEQEIQKHLDMEQPVLEVAPDRLLLCGPLMHHLWERVQAKISGAWYPDPESLLPEMDRWLKDGDTVLVKSSGHKLARIVEHLLREDAADHDAQSGPAAPPGPVVAFGGDVNLGRRMHTFVKRQGNDNPLGRITALAEADFSVVNLECVVATHGRRGVDKGEGGSYYFRARPEQLEILRAAGVRMVATANNHSGDYGPEALFEQRALLDSMGLLHAGSGVDLRQASAPVHVRVKDCNLAIFSLDATTRQFAADDAVPGIWYLPIHNPALWYSELVPRIREARELADVVLVAAHWGDNHRAAPSPEKIAAGRAIIDAGADAVLGSSAHNLQGLEIYKNRPIIHDAGDLLWDYLRRGPEPGGLFTLTLSRAGVTEVRFLPVLQQSGRALPVTGDAARSVIERFAQQCADLGASLELCPDCARVALSPPRRHTPPPAGKALEPPHPGLAPKPLAIPLPEWFIEAVPEHARMEPVKLGPLTLRGLYVPPSCRSMRKRQLLWVETYWSLEERIPESLLLSLEARPVSGAFPPFGQSMWHEPCDWMWPTSRWEPGVIYKDVAALRPPPPKRLVSAELALTCEVRDGNTTLGVYESPVPLFVALPSKR